MKSKKIISSLLVLGVLGSVFLGYKVCANGIEGENIKQEVVYTSSSSSDDVEDSFKVKGEEKEEYTELSKQILKRYLNVQDNEYDDLTLRVSRISEKTLRDMQTTMKRHLEEKYANNKISKEQYDEEMQYCNGGPKDSYESRIKNLDHNSISIVWINQSKCYNITLNEKTNEIEAVVSFYDDEDGVKLDISKEELKNTADKFIRDTNPCNIEDLNFEGVEASADKKSNGEEYRHYWKATYNNKNDNNKKTVIEINMYTGKVQSIIFS